jgi:sulfate adenylyltransferase
MVGEDRFIEVFVDTPVDECEKRDVKGLFALAKRGEIKGFTGVDDAYEPPTSPELTINTVMMTAEESARLILDFLVEKGFMPEEKMSAHAAPERLAVETAAN